MDGHLPHSQAWNEARSNHFKSFYIDCISENSDAIIGHAKSGQLMYTLYCHEDDSDDVRIVTRPIHDVRGLKCPICSVVWVNGVRSIVNQTFHCAMEKWVHMTCQEGVLIYNEYELFYGAIVMAGLRFSGLREIPNEYDGRRPWYETDLTEYVNVKLKFGHRKRVDVIEIIGAPIPSNIFENEDVTKEIGPTRVMIHAWSDDDVRRYVKEIAAVLQNKTS